MEKPRPAFAGRGSTTRPTNAGGGRRPRRQSLCGFSRSVCFAARAEQLQHVAAVPDSRDVEVAVLAQAAANAFALFTESHDGDFLVAVGEVGDRAALGILAAGARTVLDGAGADGTHGDVDVHSGHCLYPYGNFHSRNWEHPFYFRSGGVSGEGPVKRIECLSAVIFTAFVPCDPLHDCQRIFIFQCHLKTVSNDGQYDRTLFVLKDSSSS